MDKYNEKDLRFITHLKKKIVENHKKCKGVGYKDENTPCECMMIFMYVKELYFSRVPSDYWQLSLKDLEVDIEYKKLTKDFIDNLDNAIEQGLGMIFFGDKGIGKTSLMCEIGKNAIIRRFLIYYEFIQKIVNDNFDEEHPIWERIKISDLILIDECDKVMMRENSNIPKHIDLFLRELTSNNKAIILSTNFSEEEFESKFGLTSMMKRKIKFVSMEGRDFSEKKQEIWYDTLKNSNIDFFCDNILKMAEKFYSNQHIADEKEYDSIIGE